MTEYALRQQVCNIMLGWVGGVWQGTNHRTIINIWNSGKDAGQYTMSMSDPYCAATVSAAWIKAGIAQYTGKEVSCSRFISVAKAKGIWVENDAHTPKIGDAVLYDWADGSSYASYDNVSDPDHIGLVVSVNGSLMTIAEGNMSGGKIGTRSLRINGRYIRGYICPNYAAIAAAIGGNAVTAPTSDLEGDFDEMKKYRNGSTDEPVYADTALTQQTGSLNPWEECDCLGVRMGRPIVRYVKDGTNGTVEKIGFVEWTGGVQE